MIQIAQFSKEQPVQPKSLDDFCRVCLLRKPSLRPLTGQFSGVMIAEMLLKLTGTMLNMQEHLPRVICERCLVKLDLAYSIAEEFRMQDELLRQFRWGGGPLVDRLVEYGHGEESRRKTHSEEVIRKLADESRAAVEEPKPTIKREPLDVVDEFGEHRSEEDSNLDDGRRMVLELGDLRTASGLTALKQELPDETSFEVKILPSPVEFGMEQDDDDKDSDCETGNQDDGFLLSPMGSGADKDDEGDDDFEEQDDDRDADFCPNRSGASVKNIREKITGLEDDATKCPECGKEFPNPVSLKRHYVRHIVRKKGKFRCEECNKNFATKAELRLHKVTHINRTKKGKSPLECKYCRKIFSRKFRLAQHQKRHELQNDVEIVRLDGEELDEPQDEAPVSSGCAKQLYECKYCQKVFVWQSRLKQHEEQHERLRAAGVVEPMSKTQQEAPNTGPINDLNANANTQPPYYECSFCPKIFHSGARFRHHLKCHEKKQAAEQANPTPDPRFKCPKCKCSYEEEWKLELHLKRHETVESGKYRCKTCDHAFATPMDLRRHEKKHAAKPEWQTADEQIPPPVLIVKNDRKFFKCRQCVKIFISKTNYFSHAQIHVAIKTGAFKCPDCGKRYGQRCRLRMHLREKHGVFLNEEEEEEQQPEEQTLLHCNECDTLFTSEESYEVHLREHNSSGGGPGQEPIIGASDQLAARQDVKVPFIKVEPTVEESDTQQTQLNLTRVKTESPMVVLPIQNVEVVQQPSTSGAAAAGNESSEEPKEFKCELCGKGYSQKGGLNRHIRHVHKLDGAAAVSVDPAAIADTQECDQCKKHIKRKLFSEHLKHHENVRLRRFVCELCDKPFRTAHHMREHVVARSCEKTSRVEHQEEGRYKCEECGRAYNNSQSIESHMKRHKVLREERFKCGICQKVFGAKRELELHTMRTHEPVL